VTIGLVAAATHCVTGACQRVVVAGEPLLGRRRWHRAGVGGVVGLSLTLREALPFPTTVRKDPTTVRKDKPMGATTIVNTRVFDGYGVAPWTSVRFTDGVISQCSDRPLVQPGDDVFDADAGVVVPGLIDAHTHLLPGALRQALIFGVTTELDMFSKPELVARVKEEAARRHDVADVRSAGIGATAPGRAPVDDVRTVSHPEQPGGGEPFCGGADR